MVSASLLVAVTVSVSLCAAAAFDLTNKTSIRFHSLRFRGRRMANWLPTALVYALFYCCRYNVAAGNVESVQQSLGLSSADFALVMTCGYWAYAVSAPFTGMLADKFGGRNSIIIASFGTAACNLALGLLFSSGVLQTHASLKMPAFASLFALNFVAQGLGTCAVVKINSCWYLPLERGTFSGIYNVVLSSGYYLSLGIGPSVIATAGWSYVFTLPAIGLFALSFVMLGVLANSPEDAGLYLDGIPPPLHGPLLGDADDGAAAVKTFGTTLEDIDEDEDEEGGAASATRSGGGSSGGAASELLHNPAFLCYLCAVFCLCWTRDGLITWLYAFLEDERSGEALSSDTSALVGGAITIGGIVGGMLCGWLSDVVFRGARLPPIILFTCLQAFALAGLWLGRGSGDAVVASIVFALCLCILGCYTLLSYTIPTDLPSHVVGTAAGLMTSMGYVSSGLSSLSMRQMIQAGGYFAWWLSLLVATVLAGGFVLFGAYWNKRAAAAAAENGEAEAERAGRPRGASLLPGFGGEIIGVRRASRSARSLVRIAGIQDELLRLKEGPEGASDFYLFASPGTAGERIIWRTSPATPKSRAFLESRQNDPTSYFGTKTAMHLC